MSLRTTITDLTTFGAAAQPARTTAPTLIFEHQGQRRELSLDHTPFGIGRKTDKDLVIPDPRVSRDHAQIEKEGDDYYIADQDSKWGTFVNGQRVKRQKLQRNDLVQFGSCEGTSLIFHPVNASSSASREFLTQIASLKAVGSATSDLEKLRVFLDAARKLNSTGALDEILVTLLEATLQLTGAERAFVFLRNPEGELRVAAGRNSKGQPLADDHAISRSVLEEAASSASEFVITDTTKATEMAERQSIVANELRTIICIPLRRVQIGTSSGVTAANTTARGVLYLDSRFATAGGFTKVGHDILHAIATEAAALVENAALVEAEEASRRYQQELTIAAGIQQRLMTVTIPEVPYAQIRTRMLACRDIGGDFYDVVMTRDGLAVVIADVCGKGISAALMASILQGMIYAHLVARSPLEEIAQTLNRFVCDKDLGAKYATMFILRLSPSGEMEYINCGHIHPVLVTGGQVTRPECSNLPVGLLADVSYKQAKAILWPGDRLVLVTDGVTEAENPRKEYFADERLEQAAAIGATVEELIGKVHQFCEGTPLNDDCTVVDVRYLG
jgi:serine phosphatase RsbU (regulator of sigma subunit)